MLLGLRPRSLSRIGRLAATIILLSAAGARAQPFSMKTGTYTGDGTGSHALNVGFAPDVVLIKGDGKARAVLRTSTIAGDLSKELANNNTLVSNRIVSLDADGFTVGSDSSVNANGLAYYWTAFQSAPGSMVVGTYTGDASPDRHITVGLQPAYVIVISEGSNYASHRVAELAVNKSYQFSASLASASRIKDFDATGFLIGTNVHVNAAGQTYHYIAWAATADRMSTGVYTGDGSTDRDIVAPGFQPDFVLVEHPAAGFPAVLKTSNVPSKRTLPFDTTSAVDSDGIEDLLFTGFRVGSHVGVNDAGQEMFYAAFGDGIEQPVADVAVSAAVDNPTPSELEAITYKIGLVNAGPDSALGIVVTDLLPPGVTYVSHNASSGTYDDVTGLWAVGTMAAGVVDSLTIDATLDPGTAGTTITNTAAITAATRLDPVAGNDVDSVSVDVNEKTADIQIAIGVDDAAPTPGQSVVFSIDLTNAGPDDATGVSVTDLLPGGLSYVSGVPSAGAYDDVTGVWSLGPLASGSGETLSIVAAVDSGAAGAVISNVAEVTGLVESDPDSTNNSAFATVSVTAAQFRVVTGTYTGTGAGPRSIAGLGVQPSAVLIRAASAATYAVVRTATMAAGLSKPLGTSGGLVPGRIVSLDNDGFTVATDPSVNAFGVEYYWTAFCAGDSVMALGSYIGNGVDNRDYTAVGFQPDYLVVMAETNQDAIQRFATEQFDESIAFHNDGEHPDRIQDFVPLGFQVGKHNTVNENGTRYHYLAWRQATGSVEQKAYTGVGAPDSITTIFLPELVILKHGGGQEGVHRSGDTGTYTLPFRNTAPFGTGITSLQSDRFTIGADDRVNKSGEVYHWVSFRGSPLADLSVGVAVDDPFPNEGDTLRFAVELVNLGPAKATGVQASSLLPAGLSYLAHSTTHGSYLGGSGLWGVGVVAAGDTARLWIDATVDAGTGGSTIEMSVDLTARNEDDSDPANDADTASVTVQSTDLSLSLTADRTWAFENDTLTCTVTVTNNGPDGATGVVIAAALPAGLTYVSHSASDGAYDDATGQWDLASLGTGASEQLDVVVTVDLGTVGSVITPAAAIGAIDQADPTPGNNASSVDVQVATPISLDDEPGSLFPSETFAGAPDLKVRIGINNATSVGVLLGTSSEVEFTDGVNTYTSTLANPTYVPADAVDFTISFAAAAVPSAMVPGALYPLTLRLSGVSDESAAYAETLSTTGSNEIDVAQTRVGVAALVVGNGSALPGSRDETLLALRFSNGYGSARSLDTLVVFNLSTGPGNQGQIDAELEALHLYYDADSTGSLGPSDVLIASSSFAGGRAAFDVGGAWSMPGYGIERLLVSADVDSSLARDGDVIDAAVLWSTDVVFVEPTVVEDISPLYPINSYGTTTVDGMAAYQLSLVSTAPDTLYSGDPERLLASVVVPQNGYEADVLNGLDVLDSSGGFDPGDFSAVRLHLDDGDASFDPASDAVVGAMVFSGDRYSVTGLSVPIAGALRLFVAADVSTTPGNGDTFRASIPAGGVRVASGNDGPVDVAVSTAGDIVLINVEEVDVSTLPLGAFAPNPGDRNVPLLRVRLINSTLGPVTLDSVEVRNTTAGAGSQAELDASIEAVRVYADDGNGIVDPWDTILADNLTFDSGTLTTTPLGATIAVGTPYHLLFVCDVDSFCAADGDTLRVRVADAAAIHFGSSPIVNADFPLATTTDRVVDGMMSHQVPVYPSADSTVITLPTDNLVFEFALAGNGYRPDTLTSLQLINQGTATPDHIERLALYVDGGDEVFDAGAGDDVYAGDFTVVGLSEYVLSGLDVPLGTCAAHTRFYAAADVVADPLSGASIQMSIPVLGVEMASDNDGPIDDAVSDPSVQFVPKPDELTAFPYSVGNARVHPRAQNTLNFGVGFYNGFDTAVELQSVNLFQQGTAVSGEIETVHAYADADTNGLFDPAVDQLLASSTSSSSYYSLGSLGLSLAPKKITYLFVTYDLVLSVRDSVSVNFQVNGPFDLAFTSGSVAVEGEFPINSPGVDVTDGMIAEQIALSPAPEYRASPGESNILALDFTVPPNGFLQDILRGVRVRSSGTAVAGQDITTLNLWVEDNGDDEFNPTSDRLATSLSWIGSAWRNPALISESVTAAGLHCYVTADIAATAADNRTIRLSLPVGGITVASGNDGPIDAGVENPDVQVISTDPLITSVDFDRATYSIGQSVAVTMHVRNAGLTPLLGVHPSALSISGAGTLAPVGGPTPAALDLAPGADGEFSWTFDAASAGDVDVCGGAFDVDSTEASQASCAGGALLQKKPFEIVVSLEDIAPTGVNRGQENVALAKVHVNYNGYDSLSTAVEFDALLLGFVDQGGADIAPNSRLAGLTLVSSTGSSYAFSSADSTTSPMRLRLSPPITVVPGALVDLAVTADVSAAATLAPFALAVDALADIDLRDANDGLFVTPSSGETFPWQTNSILVTSPAETLAVSSTDTSSTTINVGQEQALLLDGVLLNEGAPQSANMLVTRLTFDFYNSAGLPIDAGEVIRELAIVADGENQFLAETFPAGSNHVACDLTNTLLLTPGTPKPFQVLIAARSFPSQSGFYVVVESAASTVARDANSGAIVKVSADFPLPSRRLTFQLPATRLEVSGRNDSQETILPSATNVQLLTMTLFHPDTTGASAIAVDSLALEFIDPLGNPLFPGDWLSALRLVSGGTTLTSITTLSITESVVECRLNPPVTLAPGDTDSVAVVVDAKGLVAPTRFFVRTERSGIHALDVNDGTRVLGVDGNFPLLGGPYWLRIPAANVFCDMTSRIPANITGGEKDLAVFDLTLENRNAPGYTGAMLDTVVVGIDDVDGRVVTASDIVSAARLVVNDSASIAGTFNGNNMVFSFSAGALGIDAGNTAKLALKTDLHAAHVDCAFRFVVREATSLVMRDASTDEILAPQHEGGYPIETRPAYVLGASSTEAFTNYPNPFAAGREETHITFYLDQPSRVSLDLYTLWGEHVGTLLSSRRFAAGLHQDVTWNGRTDDGDVVNNGVYYLVLEIAADGGGSRTLKRKVGVIR